MCVCVLLCVYSVNVVETPAIVQFDALFGSLLCSDRNFDVHVCLQEILYSVLFEGEPNECHKMTCQVCIDKMPYVHFQSYGIYRTCIGNSSSLSIVVNHALNVHSMLNNNNNSMTAKVLYLNISICTNLNMVCLFLCYG